MTTNRILLMSVMALGLFAAEVVPAEVVRLSATTTSESMRLEQTAVTSSGYSGSISQSAFRVIPATSTVFSESIAAGHLRAKYGSRLYCEVVRGKTVRRWSLIGCVLGAVGGYFGDRDYNRRYHLEGEDASSNMLVLGALLGAGGGWLFGEWRAPDCTPLDWTNAEREYAALVEMARERYQTRLRTYKNCVERNSDRSAVWGYSLGLAGGVLGGVIGYSQGADVKKVENGLIGGLIGLGIGVVAGYIVGEHLSEPCGEYPILEFVPLSPLPSASPSLPE